MSDIKRRAAPKDGPRLRTSSAAWCYLAAAFGARGAEGRFGAAPDLAAGAFGPVDALPAFGALGAFGAALAAGAVFVLDALGAGFAGALAAGLFVPLPEPREVRFGAA